MTQTISTAKGDISAVVAGEPDYPNIEVYIGNRLVAAVELVVGDGGVYRILTWPHSWDDSPDCMTVRWGQSGSPRRDEDGGAQ